MFYKLYLKRFLDVVVSFLLILVFSPILISATIILWIVNDGKPFYFQYRPGKDLKGFYIIKFKSMKDTKGDDGTLLPDDMRVTKIGEIIRKYSIDELPQLLNVLFGQMSLIGPRPLIFEYIPLYSKEQMRRHEMKPGITGWAQVNGRNAISWGEKFAFDVWYIDNVSFLIDMKIILMTLKKVIKKENVDFTSSVIVRRFNGNN